MVWCKQFIQFLCLRLNILHKYQREFLIVGDENLIFPRFHAKNKQLVLWIDGSNTTIRQIPQRQNDASDIFGRFQIQIRFNRIP